MDLAGERLRNQRLASAAGLSDAAGIVSWLGAVQAQDYPGAKWAIGLRSTDLVDADVERAFNEGSILRTHVLRPTWHFVAPADIRWMLALTRSRVNAAVASYYRRQGLDAPALVRSHRLIERALAGGSHLTRAELGEHLRRRGIQARGMRLALLTIHAELAGLICSGPQRGKVLTYALLEERVPPAAPLTRDESLAELTRRYYVSHGPATVRDFVWWSGLTVADTKRGLEMNGRDFTSRVVDGLTYWQGLSRARRAALTPGAHLLPNYDEYLIAYKDRGRWILPLAGTRMDEYGHFLIVGGRLAGTWRRAVAAETVPIAVTLHRRLSRAERRELTAAATRYGRFIGLAPALSVALA
jgi:Winged helix DNA-binding domain